MKRLATFAAAVAALAVVFGTSRIAQATWPTDEFRTISGYACGPFSSGIARCPFVSDSESFFGDDNAIIYVDLHVSATTFGHSTSVTACRQSWTGSAVSCGSADTQNGTGYHDFLPQAFDTVAPGNGPYDYYYVEISTSETIDKILGAGYGVSWQ